MDGWAFAGELKQRRIELPILVMNAGQGARHGAQDVEAVAHVAKPFDLDNLSRAVHARLVG